MARSTRIRTIILLLLALVLSFHLLPASRAQEVSSTGVDGGLEEASSSSGGDAPPDGSTGEELPIDASAGVSSSGDSSSSSSSSSGEEGSSGNFSSSSSSSTGLFNHTTLVNCTAINSNCTSNLTASSSSSSTGYFLSSTAARDDGVPPGGSVGHGGSSFGSTDAIFLTTVLDVWIDIMLWTMVFTSFAFVGASFVAIRANKSIRYLWLWLPPVLAAFGAGVGFMHGTVSAALIAAASISIPYPVGIDIAAGLGIGQAICIIYFHLGRADFIHR